MIKNKKRFNFFREIVKAIATTSIGLGLITFITFPTNSTGVLIVLCGLVLIGLVHLPIFDKYNIEVKE